jgi:Protein of unknown function (DUF1559)
LIIPAVQSARESSRRLQCLENLKQIGIALGQFQGIHGVFPPAEPGKQSRNGRVVSANWHAPQVMLLPFVEQTSVYNAINFAIFDGFCTVAENVTARAARLSTFVCPSESSSLLSGPTGPNSYRANVSPSPYYWDMSSTAGVYPGGGGGAFTFLHDIGPSSFTDGLSNTVMMSEKLMGAGPRAAFTKNRDDWCLGWPNSNFPPADDLIRLCQQTPLGITHYVSGGGRTWYCPDFEWTWYNHVVTPNFRGFSCRVSACDLSSPDSDGDDGGIFGASSSHGGGVHCVLGDGSVRFIKDSIDLRTWRALSTRAGGEPVSSADY